MSTLGEIVVAFDGIMVARGEIGVEIPLEQVPLVQRRAILLAPRSDKPAIAATQMPESMVVRPRPTRPEVSDVSTAVFDGADAMTLSAETSVGAHPREAVLVMSRIIEAAEDEAPGHAPLIAHALDTGGIALVQAAVEVAGNVSARTLAPLTRTGATARRITRHRPTTPNVALTPLERVRRQLAHTLGRRRASWSRPTRWSGTSKRRSSAPAATSPATRS